MKQEQILVRIKDLKKYYPVKSENLLPTGRRFLKAVDGVSFDLEKGKTLGLVGESGCGKSTTGALIAGIEKPDAGEIDRYDSRIQMIFQDPYASLNPRKRIYDIIAGPMLWHKLTDKEHVREELLRLMEDVGLPPESLERYPHQFSGGQRQRICIAKALSLNPSVLICDEPVSALDMSIQAQILNLFKDIQEKRGLSYLFISHSLGAVHYVSHRTAVMYLGRIVEIGEEDQIYKNPFHPYTQILIASVPAADPAMREEEKAVPSGEVPSAIDLPSGCRFRDRCPFAFDRCQVEEPSLMPAGDGEGHLAACFRPEQNAYWALNR